MGGEAVLGDTLHYLTAVTRQTRKDITSKKDGSTGVGQGEGTGGWDDLRPLRPPDPG